MKRVTVLFEDESLYRQLKAEAAREGRPVKEVLAEAVSEWLRTRSVTLSAADRKRWQEALDGLAEIRRGQPVRSLIDDTLAELREEYSRPPGDRSGEF